MSSDYFCTRLLDDAVGVRQSLLRLLLPTSLIELSNFVKLAVSKAGLFYPSDKRVGTHPELLPDNSIAKQQHAFGVSVEHLIMSSV